MNVKSVKKDENASEVEIISDFVMCKWSALWTAISKWVGSCSDFASQLFLFTTLLSLKIIYSPISVTNSKTRDSFL